MIASVRIGDYLDDEVEVQIVDGSGVRASTTLDLAAMERLRRDLVDAIAEIEKRRHERDSSHGDGARSDWY